MAPQHAFLALLSLAVAANAQFSSYRPTSEAVPFWTYTSRYAAIATPSVYTSRNGGSTTYTMTDRYRTVKSTVTPTATPTSTSSYWSSHSDVEVVYYYYGLNAVALSDLEPEYDDPDYSSTRSSSASITTSIDYSMPVVMSAPASCPSQFTITTTASVEIPSIVRNQITPTSTINGGLSTAGRYYTYSLETWYLSAGAAPFTLTDDYYYEYYVRSCSTPPTRYSTTSSYNGGSGTGSGSGSGSSGDDNNSSRYCSRYSYYCGEPPRTWVIIIATVFPGLFLLGFLENYLWFRRLMNGKSSMRLGTICWIVIFLLAMCFTRMQDARSKEDQKVLQEKWKNMGSGAAFKAWLKWGFRLKYPEEYLGQYSKLTVGVVPAGQPLHPAMSQAPAFMSGPSPPGAPGQVYYYGPPPPGWVPTPDSQGFMPQGYMPSHQPGYYAGDLSKNVTTVSTSPVLSHPANAQQPQAQPVSPIGSSPQPPQPVHHARGIAPSPPPQGPASNVSEAPTNPAPTATNAPQLPPPKNDPNDRSLYE
jgi:hypothetical protein